MIHIDHSHHPSAKARALNYTTKSIIGCQYGRRARHIACRKDTHRPLKQKYIKRKKKL